MTNAIHDFHASVANLHPNTPLAGCKLVVEQGKLRLLGEGVEPLRGVAMSFPEDCTIFDLLEAIELDGGSLEEALAYVGRMANTSVHGDRIVARKAGAHALAGFMDIVMAVRLEGQPMEAA